MDFLAHYNHGFNIDFFDNLMPWEREVYLTMLEKKLQEKAEKAKNKGKG